jgi:hypothetical protein
MEFHESLKKQVGDWTWRYLHTTQTVHLLLNDPSSPPAVKVLSTANVNTKRDAAKFKELSVDSSLSPAENLDKLVLARSWRTDPLEQADKESKLFLAEQLRFWKKEKKLLERIEKELEERSPQSSNHQKESFWSIWEPRDESEERKEWCELVKKSESESVIRELRAFADSTPTGQQPSMEWVFAKSLSDAIDWRNPENPFDDPDGSMDDCLKELIQDFNLFQKVAYEYQSEVLHVSARDFSEREREFLSAYDLFVQQNFSECKKSIDDYRKRLDKFGKQAELSENLFRIQKDLLHALPHIVSVCQRLDAMEARSSNRRDDQRQFSEKLFELVQGYGELEMELSSAIAQVTLPALEKKASLEKIGDDLDRLVEEIGKHFDEYGDAKSDEIQRIQIGLTWPFLKTQTRKKFLENLPSLMNNPSGGSVKAPDYEKKEGIDRLPGARISQGLLSSFFTEDPRFNGWCKQDVDNSGQSLRDLYTASVQVRLFALPLAQNLSLSNQTDARSQSAKRGWENWQQWLQWRTAEVRVERLARGMWGYGDLLKDGLQNVYAKRAVQALRNSLKRREKGLDLIEEIS